MEPDLNINEINKAKNQVLDKILNNLKSWDGEIESGISLIEANQVFLEELKELNEKLSISPIESTYDEEYESKLHLIIEEQSRLSSSLRNKQDELRENITQINKKDKVLNNYINTEREPIFINKKLY